LAFEEDLTVGSSTNLRSFRILFLFYAERQPARGLSDYILNQWIYTLICYELEIN